MPHVQLAQTEDKSIDQAHVNTDIAKPTPDGSVVANPDGGASTTFKWEKGLKPDSLLRKTFVPTA